MYTEKFKHLNLQSLELRRLHAGVYEIVYRSVEIDVNNLFRSQSKTISQNKEYLIKVYLLTYLPTYLLTYLLIY